MFACSVSPKVLKTLSSAQYHWEKLVQALDGAHCRSFPKVCGPWGEVTGSLQEHPTGLGSWFPSCLFHSLFTACLSGALTRVNWFIRTQSDGAINAVTHVYNPSARAVEERSQKLQVMLRLHSGFPVSDS